MRKFFSVHYSAAAFNLSMLLVRIVFGGLLAQHGLDKLMHFSDYVPKFYNLLGMGSQFSLILCIFAELFCSLFVILGLFTRLTVIPIIINMLVALFAVHKGTFFTEAQAATLFTAAFLVLLFCGPGRISVDGLLKK